jgi:hypothetical protein
LISRCSRRAIPAEVRQRVVSVGATCSKFGFEGRVAAGHDEEISGGGTRLLAYHEQGLGFRLVYVHRASKIDVVFRTRIE